MDHHPLIATIAVGLVLAFVLGAAAQRLRVSPLVGYLIAGIVVGPYTPGFIADQALASELAEIGVILLMFGVGLHFSLGSLLSVASIAIPGAIAQISVATLLGMGLAWTQDWNLVGGFVFGLSLSVASTVVLLRAMQERRLLETNRGKIAVGWLVVEDLVIVVALVLVPPLTDLLSQAAAVAPSDDSPFTRRDIVTTLAITLGQVLGFVILMLVVGRRVIPWVLHYVAHTGSRELFRLSVLAIALGVAYGATELFGISFALGAFFAGMMLHESPLSQRAAEESLPLRDAFAVLFFVSVGMLFDPGIVVRKPFMVFATLFVILIGKSLAALLIVRIFGHPLRTALTIAASLAQIGEFSFILAGLGVVLQILPPEGRDLILAGALISILANPLFFYAVDRFLPPPLPKPQPKEAEAPPAPPKPGEVVEEPEEIPQTELKDHAVLIGYGRVGRVIGEELQKRQQPFLVVEERTKTAEELTSRGIEVISANGALSKVLAAANLQAARWLFVAIPDAFEAGQIVNQARDQNADLPIIARAHSDAEVDHLIAHGATFTVMGEREIALGMLDFALGHATPSSSAATTPVDGNGNAEDKRTENKGRRSDHPAIRNRPAHEPGRGPRQHGLSRRPGRAESGRQERCRTDARYSGDNRQAARRCRQRQVEDFVGADFSHRHCNLQRDEQGLGGLGFAGQYARARDGGSQACRPAIHRRDHGDRRALSAL
jgi:monovalent cation:H+ antiporter-2, CPA2 family